MRYLLLIVLLVVLGGGTYIYFNMPPAPAVAGDIAPDFTLEDTEGNKVTLSSLRGKVVMVNFWATWCPPCKEEMPSMERLNKMMAGEDFVMLAINADDNGRDVVPDFLKKNPHDFTVLYDDQGAAKQSYGVYKMPESFIINKGGKIVEKVVGAIDWASPKTVAYIKNLIKG
ncbi:Peroxiredoxin [Malonomonas rubra DSM 5091]|uniref:Peroxiredoxin n=1 Tax=Malonomonas rubra DSM 5091 TaxID=1122189 RepID=A0A1M6N7J4_MALRU|nr:TlpA disulfide reductase family protein [Malonomonas rubra]SHJ91651.1 Peroxiredoxin [Malonomonas rubra DSM 5091]